MPQVEVNKGNITSSYHLDVITHRPKLNQIHLKMGIQIERSCILHH